MGAFFLQGKMLISNPSVKHSPSLLPPPQHTQTPRARTHTHHTTIPLHLRHFLSRYPVAPSPHRHCPGAVLNPIYTTRSCVKMAWGNWASAQCPLLHTTIKIPTCNTDAQPGPDAEAIPYAHVSLTAKFIDEFDQMKHKIIINRHVVC